jgi:DnaJ-domain-containing protein 1
MDYVIKEITETVDFLELNEDEFDSLNNLFYKVVASKYPNLKKFHQIGEVRKCILTDDFSRVEFIIKPKIIREESPTTEQQPPPTQSVV